MPLSDARRELRLTSYSSLAAAIAFMVRCLRFYRNGALDARNFFAPAKRT